MMKRTGEISNNNQLKPAKLGHLFMFVGSMFAAYGFADNSQITMLLGLVSIIIADSLLTQIVAVNSTVKNIEAKKGKSLYFENEKLTNKIKAYLISSFLNLCLDKINSKPFPMYFASLCTQAEIRKLAKNRDVYTFEDHSIKKYYYYSEPGNPFLMESYESLADFIYPIFINKARESYVMLSMACAVSPEKCPVPSIKSFIEKNKIKNTQIENVTISMEVQKYFAKLAFKKLDVELAGLGAKILNIFVFNYKSGSKKSLLPALIGKWSGPLQNREYSIDSFKNFSKKTENEYVLSTIKYTVNKVINGMLVTSIEPNADELAKEERIIFSKNLSRLTIFDENGVTRFFRQEET